ncbi:MAG: hypothetical protein JWM81_306 [Candidatus Saccharibacteria bacterium]|nr:hypothetical protein [Candidatus Saccharibacteria bacterium]
MSDFEKALNDYQARIDAEQITIRNLNAEQQAALGKAVQEKELQKTNAVIGTDPQTILGAMTPLVIGFIQAMQERSMTGADVLMLPVPAEPRVVVPNPASRSRLSRFFQVTTPERQVGFRTISGYMIGVQVVPSDNRLPDNTGAVYICEDERLRACVKDSRKVLSDYSSRGIHVAALLGATFVSGYARQEWCSTGTNYQGEPTGFSSRGFSPAPLETLLPQIALDPLNRAGKRD